MRSFSAFIALVAGSLLLAAAVNYPLYQLLSLFGDVRADRVLYRSAMVFVAIGLWPLLGFLGLRDLDRLGLPESRTGAGAVLSRGFVAGAAILLVLSTALVVLDIRFFRVFDASLAFNLIKVAVVAVVAGFVIAVIEEVFFRGAVFAGLRERRGILAAAALSAAFYAATHFLRPAPAPEVMTWSSGFAMLAGGFDKFATPGLLQDSFAALFVAGFLLALLRERTGGILFGIGMHAGWIFVIRLTRTATDVDHQAPMAFLIGSYDQVIGWLAAAWLVLVVSAYWFWKPRTGALSRRA